jgi:hypothetical protein
VQLHKVNEGKSTIYYIERPLTVAGGEVPNFDDYADIPEYQTK